MKHKFEEHKAGECTREGHCVICDGGLKVCEICGCAEGSLATECPGYRCYVTHSDLIYDGKVDFINGKWVDNSLSP